MRLKSELYKKEQNEIVDKIINILQLDDRNSIVLYKLENDKDKVKKIMDLIPTIRKYFSFNNIKAVGEPKKIKRPWLSIIRQITKLKYDMVSCDYRIEINDKKIRTKRYYFYSKE